MDARIINKMGVLDDYKNSNVFDMVDGSKKGQIAERGLNSPVISVSKREIEVLQLVSEGLTVKEIASLLYLSTHTIISHKQNLLEKFDARNSVDLTVKAIRFRVISI